MRHQGLGWSCLRGSWAPVLASLGIAAGSGGCSDPQGEIVVVVDTYMSIPKDIDRIQMTVRAGDKTFLDIVYPSSSEELKLPGTLGVLGEPGQTITIRAAGLKNDILRVEREAQLEVPDIRGAMLRLPLHWLCDRLSSGTPACPAGQTCIAGQCASNRVDSSALPTFSTAEVFGGGSGSGVDGSCFDTTWCFDDAVDAVPEKGALGCTIALPADATRVNVALRTEADGICGPKGCFVPLNQGGREGFAVIESRITLPSAVCDRFLGEVVGVAVSTRCAPKMERTPVCGTWSLAGKADPPDPTDPVTLAGGQMRPAGIVVAGDSVYWTNAGTEGDENGAVKKAPVRGGTPIELASGQALPSGMAIDASNVTFPFVYWINDESGVVMKASADGQGEPTPLTSWPGARTGLAVYGSDLYFTSSDGRVLRVSTLTGGAPEQVAVDQGDPLRIAANGSGVYWTDRAKGMVMRRPAEGGLPLPLGSEQKTPVAIFVEIDAPVVYWTNAGTQGEGYTDGALIKAGIEGSDDPQVLASSQALPYAIAADANNIYWTNRGNGTVMRRSKSGGSPASPLASGQSTPSAIAVDEESVYWVNAGTKKNDFRDGSIMKVTAPK